MRKIIKRLIGQRSFGLILPLAFMAAAALACSVDNGWIPVSPVLQAVISGDNSPFCAPFKITSISGLPLGPAHIDWTPIPQATQDIEGATEYTFMDEFGDTAAAPGNASSVDMPIDSKMAQYNIDHGKPISFFAVALTNSNTHPACSTGKSVSFTKSEKKAKPPQSTPQPTAQPTSAGIADQRCKSLKFISVTPYGPAKISWSPYQHGFMRDDEPYQYWYNVIIEATTTDKATIPLVNEWVKEPGAWPQVQAVNATYSYQLPPAKRIYSYTVRIVGGYASADYPDHIADGKGYIEPACTISRTMLVTLPPTPMPPTSTPVPTQAQQPQPQGQQSNPQPQAPKPPKAPSCPPGTSGDPSKGIPCIAVPK